MNNNVFTGVSFPTSLADLSKLEKLNDIRINVFRLNEANKFFPYKISDFKISEPDFDRIIDVLELCSPQGNHFVWIKNIHRAISRQIRQKSNQAYFLCRRCLFSCFSEKKFEFHAELCKSHKIQAVTLPKFGCAKKTDQFSYGKGSNITEKECEFPFYFFADIECLLEEENQALHEASKSGETIVHRHTPSAMAYTCVRCV